MTTTAKEIAARIAIAVGAVLACSFIGGELGAFAGPLVGLGSAGGFLGSLAASIVCISCVLPR